MFTGSLIILDNKHHQLDGTEGQFKLTIASRIGKQTQVVLAL